MKNLNTILVVIDPTVLRDHVIDKAKLLAHRAKAKVELFINCQVIGQQSSYYTLENEATNNEKVSKNSDELQKLLLTELENEFSSFEIPVGIELCQEEGLAQSIQNMAAKVEPDLVLKSTHKHNLLRKTLITNTDWQLIRICAAPLLLVKPYGWHKGGHVVAAVDPMHSNSEQKTLDDDLIITAEHISALIDQKPNVFHAYYYPKTDGQSPGEESPQSREARMNHNRKMYELLSRHNIELDSVKIANGDTKIEMKHYLKNIGANILIIGGLAKGILERMVVGSTAENILDDITCDLLILKTNAD